MTDKTMIVRSRLEDYLYMMLDGFDMTSDEYGETLTRGKSYHYLERGTIRNLERRGFIEVDFAKGGGHYKLTGLGRYYLTQQCNVDPAMHEIFRKHLNERDELYDLLPWGGLLVILTFALGGVIAWLVF